MYKFEKNDFLNKWYFLISDLVGLQLVFLIPFFMGEWNDNYIRLQVISVLVQICVLFFTGAYSDIYGRGYLKEAKKVLLVQSIVFALVLAIIFAEKSFGFYSREAMIWMYLCSLAVMYAERIIIKKASLIFFKDENHERSVLLITNKCEAEKITKTVINNKHSNFKIIGIGILENDKDRQGNAECCDIPIVAHGEEILDFIKDNVVDEVFLNADKSILSNTIVNACADMSVVLHYTLNMPEFSYARKTVEEFGGYEVLTCGANFVSLPQVFIKRAVDIIGSILGLLVTGALFIFIAPVIYIKSPGPIFFSQERVGKNGRKFKIYKFRSMYMDAEKRKAELMEQNKMNGFMFKMDNDPRIIKGIGSFIRKTSIDEFPQMWNVLKGDMSLVGTRPPTVDEFEKYDYHHKSRLAVKPGITGLWQVSGRSNITDFEQVVELDNTYIREWSLSLDLKILFRTVLVVLGKEGSV